MRLFVSFLKKWLSRFLFRPNRNRFFKKKIIFVINIAPEYAMKRLLFIVFSVVFATLCLRAQTLEDARNMYRAGLYAEALPVFERRFFSVLLSQLLHHMQVLLFLQMKWRR